MAVDGYDVTVLLMVRVGLVESVVRKERMSERRYETLGMRSCVILHCRCVSNRAEVRMCHRFFGC